MPASGRWAPAGISGRSALVACGQLAGAAAWVSTPLDFDAAGGTALSSLNERRLQLPRSKPAGPWRLSVRDARALGEAWLVPHIESGTGSLTLRRRGPDWNATKRMVQYMEWASEGFAHRFAVD